MNIQILGHIFNQNNQFSAFEDFFFLHFCIFAGLIRASLQRPAPRLYRSLVSRFPFPFDRFLFCFVTDFLPGETLNNYDFDDEKTEKLFGYNVPEKFFFREEQERNRRKLREVCNRQTPVLRDVYLPSSGGSPSWWLFHIFYTNGIFQDRV